MLLSSYEFGQIRHPPALLLMYGSLPPVWNAYMSFFLCFYPPILHNLFYTCIFYVSLVYMSNGVSGFLAHFSSFWDRVGKKTCYHLFQKHIQFSSVNYMKFLYSSRSYCLIGAIHRTLIILFVNNITVTLPGFAPKNASK